VVIALFLVGGCASARSSALPCVPEVQVVEVDVLVALPLVVAEDLRRPDLPKYPAWPGVAFLDVELKVWTIETGRVAREREEALSTMLRACLGSLGVAREPGGS